MSNFEKYWPRSFFLDKNFKAGNASVFGYPDQNLSDPSATKIVKLEYLSIDYFYYWVMRIQVQEVIQSWNIVKKLMNHKIILRIIIWIDCTNPHKLRLCSQGVYKYDSYSSQQYILEESQWKSTFHSHLLCFVFIVICWNDIFER